jgi:hypothetical protein
VFSEDFEEIDDDLVEIYLDKHPTTLEESPIQIAPEECFDSDADSEKDYFIKGYVEKGDITRYDKCNGDKVKEWYCNNVGTPSVIYNKCLNGCENGACIEDEDIPSQLIEKIGDFKFEGYEIKNIPEDLENPESEEIYDCDIIYQAVYDYIGESEIEGYFWLTKCPDKEQTMELFNEQLKVDFSSFEEEVFMEEIIYGNKKNSGLWISGNSLIYAGVYSVSDVDKEINKDLLKSYLEKYPSDLTSDEKICTNGCNYEDNCIVFGHRVVKDDVPSYCSIKRDIVEQKELDEKCQNNYECKSNECSNGKCISTYGLLEKIWNWLKNLFSFR